MLMGGLVADRPLLPRTERYTVQSTHVLCAHRHKHARMHSSVGQRVISTFFVSLVLPSSGGDSFKQGLQNKSQ